MLQDAPLTGISFVFKQEYFELLHPMQVNRAKKAFRSGVNNATLDTASNCYFIDQNRVEIIRQDHPTAPHIGLALSFEYDIDQTEFPYTPEYAALQLKNFNWGGLAFDKTDTLNYSGVTNAVSEDIVLEITDYRHDTIWGRFSGLLISGAGSMAAIDSGSFCVRLYQK